MVNVKLTRWTLCFSFFLFPFPLLQRPDGVGLFRRSGHLRKIPLLEHVDTWEVFLLKKIEGETEVLSLWHTVSSDSLEEWKPRDLKSWIEHVKFQ